MRLLPRVGALVDAQAALVSEACVATKESAFKLSPACVQALLVCGQVVLQGKACATAFDVALEWLLPCVGALVADQVVLQGEACATAFDVALKWLLPCVGAPLLNGSLHGVWRRRWGHLLIRAEDLDCHFAPRQPATSTAQER